MNNLLIPEDFVEYLAVNGYSVHEGDDKKSVTCTDRNTSVQFKDDTATFFTYYDGSFDEAPEFCPYGSVSGLCQLDIFKWQLVCHAFDIVNLKDVRRRAREEERLQPAY